MVKLGKIQDLEVKRITKIGAYLNVAESGFEDILLPLTQLSRSTTTGDTISVFVYLDSEERLICTTRTPKLTLGKIAVLKIVELNTIGAFLDWGLEKDLFLPFKEQLGNLHKGDEVLVALYIDSSDRLCATMNVYEVLESESPYREQDNVKGTLYMIHPQYGAFVAVDNEFHGLIPNKELFGTYTEGMSITARVKNIREDGKLELSMRHPAHQEMSGDGDLILQKLQRNDGVLALHDKSDAQEIKDQLGMSKAAFKRAIGKLYKEGIILLHDYGIELIDNTNL